MAESRSCLNGFGMTYQKPVPLIEPTQKDTSYSLNDLDQHDPIFKEIVIDFENVGLRVLNVQKLNNHLLWQKYINEKDVIEQRYKEDPDFKLNEKYLYHGTTAQKDVICTESLDSRLSKRGCRFGQGIYFSDTPIKCVHYAEKSSKNESIIVLVRVMLGYSKIYPKGKTDKLLTREPEKSDNCKVWRFYDSVVGCPKDHKEFVIYRNDRALIEYLITYKTPKAMTSLDLQKSQNVSPSSRLTTFRMDKCASKFQDSRLVSSRFKTSVKESCSNTDESGSSDEEESNKSSGTDSDGATYHDAEKASSSTDDDEPNDDAEKASSSTDDDEPNAKERKAIASKPNVSITGASILSQKRKEFLGKTGENRVHVIESFLASAGLDVAKAVELYKVNIEQKKRKMKLEVKKERDRAFQSNADKQKEITPPVPINPQNDPERWNSLSDCDRKAIIEALIDDFLAITTLPNDEENRRLSIKVLDYCNYDLDASIVSYYESL